MAATKPTQLPDFCTNDSIIDPQSGQNNVVEPTAGNKPEGWKFQQIPPRGWMNWLHNLYYNWSKYLDEIDSDNIEYVTDTISITTALDNAGAAITALSNQVNALESNITQGTVTVRAYSGTVNSGSDVTMSWYANRINNTTPAAWNISLYIENVDDLTLDVSQAGADGTYTIKPTSGGFPFETLTGVDRVELPVTVTTDQAGTPKSYPAIIEFIPNTDEMGLLWFDPSGSSYKDFGLLNGTFISTLADSNLNLNFVGKPV